MKNTMLRSLVDIPNVEGYEFIGIDADCGNILCVVHKDTEGLHRAYRAGTDELVYSQLCYWRTIH